MLVYVLHTIQKGTLTEGRIDDTVECAATMGWVRSHKRERGQSLVGDLNTVDSMGRRWVSASCDDIIGLPGDANMCLASQWESGVACCYNDCSL